MSGLSKTRFGQTLCMLDSQSARKGWDLLPGCNTWKLLMPRADSVALRPLLLPPAVATAAGLAPFASAAPPLAPASATAPAAKSPPSCCSRLATAVAFAAAPGTCTASDPRLLACHDLKQIFHCALAADQHKMFTLNVKYI